MAWFHLDENGRKIGETMSAQEYFSRQKLILLMLLAVILFFPLTAPLWVPAVITLVFISNYILIPIGYFLGFENPGQVAFLISLLLIFIYFHYAINALRKFSINTVKYYGKYAYCITWCTPMSINMILGNSVGISSYLILISISAVGWFLGSYLAAVSFNFVDTMDRMFLGSISSLKSTLKSLAD